MESTDTLTQTIDLESRKRFVAEDLPQARHFLKQSMKWADCSELRSAQEKISHAISCVDDAIEEIRS